VLVWSQRNHSQSNRHAAARSEGSTEEKHCDPHQNKEKYTFIFYFSAVFQGEEAVRLMLALSGAKSHPLCVTLMHNHMQNFFTQHVSDRWQKMEWHPILCVFFLWLSRNLLWTKSLTNIHYVREDSLSDDSWLQPRRYRWLTLPSGTRGEEWCEEVWWGG